MAEAVVEPESNLDEEKVECGYCFEYNGRLVTPKALPCGHVGCLPCLVKDVKANNVMRCPFCRKVFNISPGDLRAAYKAEEKSIFCQPCKRREEFKKAVVYCVQCETKFCTNHQQSHDDCFDHTSMTMDEYKKQCLKVMTRFCGAHTKQPLCIGCRTCREVFCSLCIDGDGKCIEGRNHNFTSISALIDQLSKKLDAVKSGASEYLFNLTKLQKTCTQAIAQHDVKTADLVKELHNVRDKHCQEHCTIVDNLVQFSEVDTGGTTLADLGRHYESVEVELTENREKSKQEVVTFLEIEVDPIVIEMTAQLLKVEADLSNTHQVDVVKEFGDAERKITELAHGKIPLFTAKQRLCSIKNVEEDAIRTIETRVILADFQYLQIGSTGHGKVAIQLKMIKLDRSIDVTGTPYSVCKTVNGVLVGAGTCGINLVGDTFQTKKLVAGINANCARTAGRNVIALHHPWKFILYSTDGCSEIRSWSHNDSSSNVGKFTVVDNHVVVPNRGAKLLALYTMDGTRFKEIQCPDLTNGNVAICDSGVNSVVVSSSSHVFKMDLPSGEVLWRNSEMGTPGAVACYRDSVILVAVPNCLWVLDNQTGEKIGIIEGTGYSDYVYDICIDGDTLVMTAGTSLKYFTLQ